MTATPPAANTITPTAWTELTIHAVPPDIARTLESAGLRPADCRICVASKVLLNGNYGESWLALGPDKIAIVAINGRGPEILWQQVTADLTGARTQSVTGGGIMVIDVKGTPQEVLRFDAGQATLFGGIAQKLNKHVAPPKKPEAAGEPLVTGTAGRLPVGSAAGELPHSELRLANTAAAISGAPLKTAREPVPAPMPAAAGLAAEKEPLEFQELLVKQRDMHCPKCQRLFPKNTKVCPFCVARSATLRRILTFADESRAAIVLMGVLMVAGTGLGLLQPLLGKYLIDDVLLKPTLDYNHLAGIVAAMGSLMLVAQLIGVWRTRIGVVVGCNVTNSIQKKAYFHLQTLSLSYFNKQQTGSLMSRINNDARQMQNFLAEGIQYTVINVLQIVGIAGVLLYMNWFLALLVLVPAPLMILVSAWVWKKVHRRYALLWSAMAAVTAHLNDSLSGIRVVKAFGQEGIENERFDKKVSTSKDRWIDAEQTWQTFVPLLNFMAQCSGLLIWYFGGCQMFGDYMSVYGLRVIAQPLTFGELTAFIAFLGMITGPLQLLTRLNDWLTRSLTAAARVFEILDAEPEIKEKSNAVAMPDCRGDIEFREVTFGYEKHKPVLKTVSLTIKPGEMIGLVGPSGAGKSTIINIIGRLYDVDEGGLYIDGVNIKDIQMNDLRKHVGYVLQDNFLFNGSVAENIAYARPEATRDEIIAAAVAANAHTFILNLPDGYDTLCGERGDRLSGGERQRIAIARAILHNPKILIMDEATSSVDTETEARIQIAMANLIKGRTTIAIAHRLSTLRHASRLIVIEDGKVAESGSHDELMAKDGGVYRKLVTIQTEWSRQIGVGG